MKLAVFLLKKGEINDLKTAEIRSISVLSCGVLEHTCFLRASGKILEDVLIKLQTKKCIKTKFLLTHLPLRYTSPPGCLFACWQENYQNVLP